MSLNDLYRVQNRPTQGNLTLWSPEDMCPEDRAFYYYMQSRNEAYKKMLERRKKLEEAKQKKAEE